MAALVAIAGIGGLISTQISAAGKTEIEVDFSNFQWQAPGYFAPGENFWREDVGNPEKPISKIELLYINDLTDVATGGSMVNCRAFQHEWNTVVKNTGGFATAHTIATHQDVIVECSNFLGLSGTFSYNSALHKNPVTGVGTKRAAIGGGTGELEGITGRLVGTVGGTTTLTVQLP